MVQITPSTHVAKADARSADAAALAALVKFGPWKRRIIRLIEAFAKPVINALDRLKPASPLTEEIRNIVVIELWNLGDIVMQTPFLINLRIHYPQARIILLTSPKIVPLIANQGLVDEIIEVRAPWAQHYSRWRKYNPFSTQWSSLLGVLHSLRALHFDLAFSARADLRDNFIMWLLNARRRVGYSFGGGGCFLTDAVVPDLRNPHFSHRWLRLLEHLGKPIRERQPRLHVSKEEQLSATKLLEDRGVRSGDFLLAVHPGARSSNRQWGEAHFEEVAERLLDKFPVKIIWFQDPGQEATAPAVSNVIPLSLPLKDFVAVLHQCGMFVCNDSGPMHIATALNVPVVVVFGPTEPAWFGPLGPHNQVVIRQGFWCRPCFDYCIFDQPYCLRAVTVHEVYHAAEKTLEMLLSPSSPEKSPREITKIPEVKSA
ncbi:MAG: glycosyltransferase family 9 protein [Acidobacteriota bacterium]|nr:glycosyltransferase family 9 protein [Acidobacteriota bacterium]